jgi:dihydroneopterin aldolase
MIGTISLTGLRAWGYHGASVAERATGQEFAVDVSLSLDIAGATNSDNVADTVHYGELANRLVSIITGEAVNLLETLATRLVEACLDDARVISATVTVHKPHAPLGHPFADVSVTLRRNR